MLGARSAMEEDVGVVTARIFEYRTQVRHAGKITIVVHALGEGNGIRRNPRRFGTDQVEWVAISFPSHVREEGVARRSCPAPRAGQNIHNPLLIVICKQQIGERACITEFANDFDPERRERPRHSKRFYLPVGCILQSIQGSKKLVVFGVVGFSLPNQPVRCQNNQPMFAEGGPLAHEHQYLHWIATRGPRRSVHSIVSMSSRR